MKPETSWTAGTKAYSFADTDRVADISQLTVTGKRVDLYGKIIPKTITITLELGGGELPEGVGSTVTRTYGSWYDLPKPTRHGYSFTYWFTAETGGSEIFPATRIMQTTDHTVYARWKQIAGHSPVREQKPETLAKSCDLHGKRGLLHVMLVRRNHQNRNLYRGKHRRS